jgi:Tol biopolymer transport system component
MKRLTSLTAGAVAATALAVVPAHATFNGANGLLVYQAKVGNHVQLFTVHPDGTGARQITHFADSDATNPSWSPNGSRIAFKRITGNRELIYTINSDGSNPRQYDKKIRLAVTWLPDGRHLLAIRSLKWVLVDVARGTVTSAGVPGGGDSPCVFPDRRVALTVGRSSDSAVAIFVGKLGGGPGSLRRITPYDFLGPKIDCSPDGSRILYSTAQPGDVALNVYSIGVDGTGKKQLTHGSGNGADSWSPDGKKIAFVANRKGVSQIFTMNTDGTGIRQLTHGADAHLAAWGTHL